MRAPTWLICGIGVLLATLSVGCQSPAMILWSPDGSAGAYHIDNTAFLIDSTGKATAPLGSVLGGSVWTADSKTLYYVASTNPANPVTAAVDWAGMSALHFKTRDGDAEPAPADRPKEAVEVLAFSGGKSTSVVKFGAGRSQYLALSPDQHWLLAVCATESTTGFAVFVCHLPSKHLYKLSDSAGFGLCFTGPNRLAYIDPDRRDKQIGKVVEVTLNNKPEGPDRTPLMDVVPAETPWLAALGDNLLLTSFPRTFPGKPIAEQEMNACKLYMWTRGNGGIVALADDVGPFFSLSPDGKRLLIEKMVAKTEQSPGKHELQIIRANGSDGHTLRDLSKHIWFAMLPTWHGNNEISFNSTDETAKPATVKDRACLQYDAVLYKLNEKEELEPIKTLSESWDSAIKPYVVIDDGRNAIATQPATRPTTQLTTTP